MMRKLDAATVDVVDANSQKRGQVRLKKMMMRRAIVLLRAQSSTLGLVAPTPDSNPMLYNASFLLFGIAIVVFGYLSLSNIKLPRAVAILMLVLGVLALIDFVFNLAVPSLGDLVGMGVVLLFLIWSLWLSWLFLKGKLI